jgi:hypothetical protein
VEGVLSGHTGQQLDSVRVRDADQIDDRASIEQAHPLPLARKVNGLFQVAELDRVWFLNHHSASEFMYAQYD